MQFLVTGYDGEDEKALDRRLAARDSHLKGMAAMKESGQLLFAAAIIDDANKMIGSSLVMEFETRAQLDAWLKEEPYTLGGVWKHVDVRSCTVAPLFSAG